MNFENNKIEKQKSPEGIFSGEIKEVPGRGKILVIAGYHFEERPWGELIQKKIKENIKDGGGHLLFLSIKNKEVGGGVISPASEKEINDSVESNGGWDKFEAIIDIHDQHEDENKKEDMVKLWLGDSVDNNRKLLFQKELSSLSRGGKSDFSIVRKYHPRVNKDEWENDDYFNNLKEKGIKSYGLSNSKIPILGFDASIPKSEIEPALKQNNIPDALKDAVNSHLKIITKFSNLVLSNDLNS